MAESTSTTQSLWQTIKEINELPSRISQKVSEGINEAMEEMLNEMARQLNILLAVSILVLVIRHFDILCHMAIRCFQ